MTSHVKPAEGYNGLTTLEKTLPSHFYFDADHYARELRSIWSHNWIYLCRSADLEGPRSYRTFTIGTQNLVVLRDETGVLRAFHNTCRHRGSVLCRQAQGRLKSDLLTCPYHAWSYALNGELKRTPTLSPIEGFDRADYPLYPVALKEWRGLLFVNLAGDEAASSGPVADRGSDRLDNWPLEDLVSGHVYEKTVRCNWKVFWENFSECLHCPGIHPELCDVVPIYGRLITGERDDPNFAAHADSDDPALKGGLRRGAQTWSMDGLVHGATIPGLSEAERHAGHSYVTSLPSVFIVAHVDYVRVVRVRPLGPELTELHAEWLFPADTLEHRDFDLENVTSFPTLVLDQDAEACEMNQQGLHSRAHAHGVLMAEEHYIKQFYDWYWAALGAYEAG